MTVRRHLVFAGFALAGGLAGAAATLGAQAPAHGAASVSRSSPAHAAGRTPDGHPDFQGVWANNTVTPLQRPKQWEGKQRLTDAEIADLQNIAAQITENDGDAQFGDGFILAVLNGSLIFAADLMRRIPLTLKLDCISASSYHGLESSGTVDLDRIPLPNLEGRHVLIIDDILDTGLVSRNDVGIALDNDNEAVARNRLPRPIETV